MEHQSHRSAAGSGDAVHPQSVQVHNSAPGSAAAQHFGLITLKLALNLFEGATGCHEWEAGFLLAEYILSNATLFRGAPCIVIVLCDKLTCFCGSCLSLAVRKPFLLVMVCSGTIMAVHNLFCQIMQYSDAALTCVGQSGQCNQQSCCMLTLPSHVWQHPVHATWLCNLPSSVTIRIQTSVQSDYS